jgi:hypothetical protein
MTESSPSTRKLILFGVAVAIPLAAVAAYFALFDQPLPPTRAPAAQAVPGGQAGSGQPSLPPNHPPIGGPQTGDAQTGPAPPGAPPGHPQMGSGRSIRIPDEVKGKWQAVKLRVEQKAGGKPPQVFTVKLGGQLDVPGSKLQVHVGEFLPALQVNGNEVTSLSNNPTNPAVMVTVSEDGKETFKGWLFGKFPEMQPFEHPTYRITLVEGIPAS